MKRIAPNRVVVLLSPVFVGLAGWVVVLAARYMPGHPKLDAGELTAVFIAGATWAATHALLWLHGWQRHEARQRPAAGPDAGDYRDLATTSAEVQPGVVTPGPTQTIQVQPGVVTPGPAQTVEPIGGITT